MLDIKFVRENPDVVKENIRKKFQDQKIPMVDEVIALDQENRNIKQEVESLRANKNKISKQIGALMAQGKKEEAEEVKKEVAASGAKIDELSAREKEVEEKIKTIMMTIPNIIDPSVPVGKDDSENVEIERFGEPVVPDFEVPYHAEIMESFDGLDPAKRILAKKLLLEYVAERGASVIISSHNLHELEDLCDHVGLLGFVLLLAPEIGRVTADVRLAALVLEVNLCLVERSTKQVAGLHLHIGPGRWANTQPVKPQRISTHDPVLRIKRQEFC